MGSGIQDVESRMWNADPGFQDLESRIWNPASGIQDLESRIWKPAKRHPMRILSVAYYDCRNNTQHAEYCYAECFDCVLLEREQKSCIGSFPGLTDTRRYLK
jgi:hypothetical protein